MKIGETKIGFALVLSLSLLVQLYMIDQPFAQERTFFMGFTPFPWDITLEAVVDTNQFVMKNGDIIALHFDSGVPWIEALYNLPFHQNVEKEWNDRKELSANKKLLVSVTPLNGGRNGMALYRGEKENMPLPDMFRDKELNDPDVKKAYLNFCHRAVEHFQPDYLAIGIEVNEFAHNSPDKWPYFLELYKHTYAELKKDYPALPVFATVTLHNLQNKGWSDLEFQQNAIRELLQYSDIVGVSYYPFMVGHSERPTETFDWIRSFTDKPIAITETGYPAEDIILKSFNMVIPGDPEKQATYFETLLERANKDNYLFVIAFLHRDYDALWEEIKRDVPEFFVVWKDCGIVDENGIKRPAFDVWNRYFSMETQMAQKKETGSSKMALQHRWVYVQTNFLVDKNVETLLSLIERSAKAGYNGIVVADSKFMRWDSLPERYAENTRKVRDACRQLKLDFIACVFPIGYSDDLLSRDPNLAEGLPVVDAPFIVREDRLMPADDSVRIVNAGFEQYSDNVPAGWQFVDQPGKISFIDTQVKYEGNASLRMQDIGMNDPQYGHGRVHQRLTVRPFTYYHVSVAVKTQDFEAANDVRIAVLAAGGASLNFFEPRIAKTQDWQRVDITFNSLEFSEVNFYLGVWGGRGGAIWWDDVQIGPAGLVNVLRRDGAPMRVTSEDGKTIYTEGVDFDNVRDPKLGNVPWPGGFSVWHEQPVVGIPAGSKLRDGQKVLISYYHPELIYGGAIMCCMSEPAVYDILKWQAVQMRDNLHPDGYFMSHDEIRSQGWDKSCAERNMTPGQILADNVQRCTDILHQTDPGKPIYVWSDMFDPHHNAQKTGKYYLVKGDGPWYGSWEGLHKDVTIVNWNSQTGKRLDSMKHFASRGHRQILAGYYDADPRRISDWLRDAAKVEGVIGVMYTTWRNNYDDLEKFAEEIIKF